MKKYCLLFVVVLIFGCTYRAHNSEKKLEKILKNNSLSYDSKIAKIIKSNFSNSDELIVLCSYDARGKIVFVNKDDIQKSLKCDFVNKKILKLGSQVFDRLEKLQYDKFLITINQCKSSEYMSSGASDFEIMKFKKGALTKSSGKIYGSLINWECGKNSYFSEYLTFLY